MDIVDDIFNDTVDDKSEERAIFSQNWKRLIEPVEQEGYREGVAAGREETYQKGFDEGYENGFKAGFSIGFYNSVLRTLKSHKFKTPPDLDLDITNLTPLDNPTRGLCHICTDSGNLLNKDEIQSNVEKMSSIPLHEVVVKQKNIIDSAVSKKQSLPDYNKVLCNLDIKMLED